MLIATIALASCDETGSTKDNSPQSDAGPSDVGGDGSKDAHNLEQLKVEGNVTLDYGSAASGVKVTARCGSKEFTTTTDEQGDYSFEADVKGCSPLVIEFVKDSYLPNIRVIHLPPPTSPVTVNVPLAELLELQCAKGLCIAPQWRFYSTDIKWGWVTSLAGKDALDFFPGEFRQPDGKLIGFVGLTYYDVVDAEGGKLDKFGRTEVCVPVPTEALDWLGDVDDTTPEVEMFWYSVDLTSGRWKAMPEKAVVKALKGNIVKMVEGICEDVLGPDGNPDPNFVPLLRSELPAVRAEMLQWDNPCSGSKESLNEIYVCGKMEGNGWYAWGVDMQEKSCYAVTATDQCDDPLPNIVFQAKGRDHGYRAETWTDWDGKACLEVIPSEPEGQDFNVDGLKGLPFWVDLTGENSDGGRELKSQENQVFDPSKPKSCSDPNSCVKLNLKFELYTKSCTP